MTLDNWFVSHPEKGRCEKRLYCFPFAGGTASAYREWHGNIPGVETVSYTHLCDVSL